MTLNKADQQVGGSWSREDHTPSPSPTPSPRERIARIIDPHEWMLHDFGATRDPPAALGSTTESLLKADAVLSAFPEAGEVERLQLGIETVGMQRDTMRANYEAAERARDEALQELQAIGDENADNVRLLDWIAGKLGVPDDEELTREHVAAWLASRDSLSAKLTQAGEALEPFGKAADRINDNIAFATNIWPESDLTKWFTGTKALFNRADFWRVREALSLIKKESGDV